MRGKIALSGLLSVACAHGSGVVRPTSAGRASAQIIRPESQEAAPTPSNIEIVAAWPYPTNPVPEYPPRAFAAAFGAAAIGVRLIIGAEGRVADIRDSPVLVSTPGPFAADFRAATEAALYRWRFKPAERRMLQDGDDLDGHGVADFRRVTEARTIPMYFDVRVDFGIVDGRGTVGAQRERR